MRKKVAGKVVLSACENNSSAAAITSYAAIPATATASGLAVIHVERQYNRCALYFGGTDTANETFTAEVYGLVKVKSGTNTCFVAVKIASLTNTLGSQAFGTAAAFIESATALWADKIADTYDDVRVAVNSEEGNEMASVVIDCTGFEALVVEMTRGSSAATMTLMAKLSGADLSTAEEP